MARISPKLTTNLADIQAKLADPVWLQSQAAAAASILRRPATLDVQDVIQDGIVVLLEEGTKYLSDDATTFLSFDRWSFNLITYRLRRKYKSEFHWASRRLPGAPKGTAKTLDEAPAPEDIPLDALTSDHLNLLTGRARELYSALLAGKSYESVAAEWDVGRPALCNLATRALEKLA